MTDDTMFSESDVELNAGYGGRLIAFDCDFRVVIVQYHPYCHWRCLTIVIEIIY